MQSLAERFCAISIPEFQKRAKLERAVGTIHKHELMCADSKTTFEEAIGIMDK